MSKQNTTAPIDYETLKRRTYVEIFRECYADVEGLSLPEQQQYVWAVGYYGFFGKIPEGILPIVKYALMQHRHALNTNISKAVAAIKREDEKRAQKTATDTAHLEAERAAKEIRRATPPEPQPETRPQPQSGQPYRVPDGENPYLPFLQNGK